MNKLSRCPSQLYWRSPLVARPVTAEPQAQPQRRHGPVSAVGVTYTRCAIPAVTPSVTAISPSRGSSVRADWRRVSIIRFRRRRHPALPAHPTERGL